VNESKFKFDDLTVGAKAKYNGSVFLDWAPYYSTLMSTPSPRKPTGGEHLGDKSSRILPQGLRRLLVKFVVEAPDVLVALHKLSLRRAL
jgi:hypothetical protein